ncbi:unnamed protein product [Rotaria sp. Silwood2]|nr:unnamed protein product [Rotaria sp. Silwood2]
MLGKALKNQIEYLPKNHENFVHTYLSLSFVYEKEENIPKALEYLEKSGENARISILPYDSEKFNKFQESLYVFKAEHFGENETSKKLIYIQAETLRNTNEKDELINGCIQELKQTSLNDFLQRITLLNTLGAIYSRKTNYKMAMKCFEEATSLYNQHTSLTLTEEQELESLMILVYFNFARLHYRQQNRATAFQILEKSLNLASKQDQRLPEVYNFAGIMFGFKGELSKAEHYFNLTIDIAKKVSPK